MIYCTRFFLFLHLSYQCPPLTKPQPCSHSRLSNVSANTDIGHRASCSPRQSYFFQLSPQLPMCSAWHAEGQSQPSQSYIDGKWGCFLFVSSAIPCCQPSPVPLETCQQTPLERDMQIESASRAVRALTVPLSGSKMYLSRLKGGT